MNKQVERLVRLLDVQAAHAHAREPLCCGALRGERKLYSAPSMR